MKSYIVKFLFAIIIIIALVLVTKQDKQEEPTLITPVEITQPVEEPVPEVQTYLPIVINETIERNSCWYVPLYQEYSPPLPEGANAKITLKSNQLIHLYLADDVRLAFAECIKSGMVNNAKDYNYVKYAADTVPVTQKNGLVMRLPKGGDIFIIFDYNS